jgi:small-conductance mechanosensitive channel
MSSVTYDEIQREKEAADTRVSFGIYFLVSVLSAVFLVAAQFVQGFFPVLVFKAFGYLLAAFALYYFWILYRRRNKHFARHRTLEKYIIDWLRSKHMRELDIAKLEGFSVPDQHEVHRTGTLYAVYAALVVINWFFGRASGTGSALIMLVVIILDLVIMKYLTEDFYFHESRENRFLSYLSRMLGGLNIRFSPPLYEASPRRRFWRYILYTIVTVGLFMLFWIWVLFDDPNRHFNRQDMWEKQLERIVGPA